MSILNKIPYIKYIKYLPYILIIILLATSVYTCKSNKAISDKYSIAMSNVKAYASELDSSSNTNKVFQLKVNQLSYFNDSILDKLNTVRKQLGIKDKNIEEMQYTLSHITKKDSLVFKHDTLFRDPKLYIDTIIGDKWVNTKLILKYPSSIYITPSVTCERFLFIESKRETIDTPKKFFLLRWFQKKQTVLNVTIKESNPWVTNKEQKFIKIIK